MDLQQRATEYGTWWHNPETEGSHGRLMSSTYRPGYKWGDYHIDSVVFWKFAHWLGHKYRSRIKPLMRRLYRMPASGTRKTWILFGKTAQGHLCGAELYALVGHGKNQFRWRAPKGNPYLREEERRTITSRYADVAMAMATA